MNQYDVIVLGCNISTLISALSLIKEDYKVLLIDKRNTIGEILTNTKVGRYHFKYGFNNLYLRNNTFNYSLNKVLDACEVKDRINYESIENLCTIKLNDKYYTLPFGIETFINYLEKEIPNSQEKLTKLFNLADICRNALNYITLNKNDINIKTIKKEFKEFYNISSLSLEEGLKKLNIENELKEILSKLCIYYGSDTNNLTYIEYLVFLINIVERGIQVSQDNLLEILLNDYINKDGKIRLKTNVASLIIEDECVNGVRLDTGEVIYTNKLVIGDNITNIYGKLIEPKDIPRKALKHLNKIGNSNKVFSIHLGLNIDISKYNIKEYTYILNDNMIVHIDSNTNNYIGNQGTSIINIHYILRDNVFIESITNRNYYFTIDRMTKKIIDEFQNILDIKVYDYIEEIKVISPFYQEIFSEKLNINEGILPKILNSKNERYIKGLYVCNGINGDIYGYRSNLVVGLGPINYFKNEGDLSDKI